MNIYFQDISMLDHISDAALLIHTSSASIHYLNPACCQLLECEDVPPHTLNLSSIFRDLQELHRVLTTSVSQSCTKYLNVPLSTYKGDAIHCDIRVYTALSEPDYLCCFFSPVLQLAEHPRVQSAQMTQDIERFFYQAVQTLSSELLFRYQLSTGTMYYFGSARASFGLPEACHTYPYSVLDSGLIYEDDHIEMFDFVQNVRNGLEVPSYLRLCEEDAQPTWFKKEYILCRDQDGHIIEAIGKLTNVQAEKELETRINLDMLTGCLVKYAFETLSTRYIEAASDHEHALLMIDLDNFKAINDNLGHQFGDMVLSEVGEKIRRLFRSSDYVGRMGGDEFMVFMKNISGQDILEQKAREILSVLDTTYKGNHHSYHISASVGIAKYPRDGKEFKRLYESADKALYDAKNRGKNAYVTYHGQLSKGTMDNTLPFDVAARTLSQHFDPKIVAEAFNLLFESRDLEISMQSVLQVLGTRFATSRVYIFELSSVAEDCYANTYEWCAEGVNPEQPHLQLVPHAILQPFFQRTNAEGILYCNDLRDLKDQDAQDIMASQGIQSFLHAYIGPTERYTYVVGFDDTHSPRIWSPIEISTLLYVSKIIAQFLNHNKILQSVTAISEERLDVLDSLNFSSYIIDIDSYQLSYFNRYLHNLLPSMKLGDFCYEAIRGKSAPCEDCPLHQLKANQSASVRSVICSEKLGINTLINACRLTSYDGRASVFVSANNVTDLVPLPATVSTKPNLPDGT